MPSLHASRQVDDVRACAGILIHSCMSGHSPCKTCCMSTHRVHLWDRGAQPLTGIAHQHQSCVQSAAVLTHHNPHRQNLGIGWLCGQHSLSHC